MGTSAGVLEKPEIRPVATALIDRMGAEQIGKFFDVNKIVNDALASIPPDKTVAVLGYYDVGTKTIRGAGVVKINDTWSFMGVLEHKLDQGKKLEGLVAVRGAW